MPASKTVTRSQVLAEARKLWPKPFEIELWVAPRAKYTGRYQFVVKDGMPGLAVARGHANSWEALLLKIRKTSEAK